MAERRRAGPGLQGGLFAPLRARLLTPVAEFLERLERMSSDWEQNATPLRTALAEREQGPRPAGCPQRMHRCPVG